MRWARSPSVCRSGPNSLTATSPRLPVSISEMRISMGWVKPNSRPGKASITLRISALNASLSAACQSLRGASCMNRSVSFRPIGSSPSSSEPTRPMLCRTSGTAALMAFCTAKSISSERCSPMDGGFCSCSRISPSSIVGMNALPVPR